VRGTMPARPARQRRSDPIHRSNYRRGRTIRRIGAGPTYAQNALDYAAFSVPGHAC
jgi:hypothetical protein